MAETYPDTEGFTYGFARAELTLNDKVYSAIIDVSADQPTESESILGTSPVPLGETEGFMDLGEGTVTFSNEGSRLDFIDNLGDAYRTKKWVLSWVLRNSQGNEKQFKCVGCRVTSNPVAHSQGSAALGGDIGFKFIEMTVNGKKAHG